VSSSAIWLDIERIRQETPPKWQILTRGSHLAYLSDVPPPSPEAAFFGRFIQTANARPTARRITPPRKARAIGAPVFARVPLEATACVPTGGSDDVVAPAASLVLVDGVVLSGVAVGVRVGGSVGDGDGLADGDGEVLGDGDGPGASPVL
jgi:hypothetical protein